MASVATPAKTPLNLMTATPIAGFLFTARLGHSAPAVFPVGSKETAKSVPQEIFLDVPMIHALHATRLVHMRTQKGPTVSVVPKGSSLLETEVVAQHVLALRSRGVAWSVKNAPFQI